MAVKLIRPWHRNMPGATVDLGAAVDEKLVRLGLAEKLPPRETAKAEKPRRKTNGS